MSIVPMQKVRLMVHTTDVDSALDTIQRSGALEFRATDMSHSTDSKIVFPNANLLPRIQHAVKFLEPYAPEIGMWRTLREGTRTALTEEEVTKKMNDTDVASLVVEDLERLQVEFADLNEKFNLLEHQYKLLVEWKTLPIKLSQLKTKRTYTLLVKGHQATQAKSLKNLITNLYTDQDITHVITEVSPQLVALTLANEDAVIVKAKQILETADAEIITPPEGIETADVEFVAVSERLAAVRGELALLHDQAEHFAITHIKNLQLAAEVLTWQHDRFAVIDDAATTKYTVVFDGWLNKNKRAEIEHEFSSRKLAAVFTDLALSEGEEPPVDIENSTFTQPFEAVTRLYGMPGYTDLDPTVFLAGFFFLFFGLSLTDVGYGLTLVLASAFILTMCKVTKATRSFAKLLLYIGFATILVGMLFGGYLGFDPALLPAPLQALQLFDPIGNPLPVFYLALGLGVLQVIVGMMLKIYSEARNGRLMGGALDQGPWLFVFAVGILYIATVTGYSDWLTADQLGNLAIIGAVLIVLSSARHGESILQKFISGAIGLYAGVAHFSDILSYSRLLALGLATSALAFAVNLIAGMLVDVPYVGFILAGAILLVGHLFTLAINTLGAFVHSARLQFVEFFGKFISGTGKEFSPLTRKKKFITIGDD